MNIQALNFFSIFPLYAFTFDLFSAMSTLLLECVLSLKSKKSWFSPVHHLLTAYFSSALGGCVLATSVSFLKESASSLFPFEQTFNWEAASFQSLLKFVFLKSIGFHFSVTISSFLKEYNNCYFIITFGQGPLSGSCC